MIKTTVGELLDTELDGMDTDEHYIYMVRDGGTIFYVGQSRNPVYRLLGHCGRGRWIFYGKSTLGHMIEANLPTSRSWQVELMTVTDCNAYSIDDAESKLIFELAPHFNVQGKRRRSDSLPGCYKTPWPKVITIELEAKP